MTETLSLLALLSDPRLAAYATGDVPVWLWSADATHILWGNPTAAAIFNAASPRALTGHTIDPKGSAALQIARLAGSLPYGAAPRLERLRGFGGRFGSALLCACSRIMLANGKPAILVIATETAGPRLALEEQARRLLVGCDEPLALFAPDGSLLHATSAAEPRLRGITSLAAIGAAPIAAAAFAGGYAERNEPMGRTALYRIGTEAATLLLGHFESQPAAQQTQSSAAQAAAAEPPATRTSPTPAEAPADTTPRDVADRSTAAATETRSNTPPAAAAQRPSVKPLAAALTDPQIAAARALAERRQPLRFVWQLDAGGRFQLGSEEFTALIGPQAASALGRTWDEISQALAIDPDGQVARALASRNTWSGITVSVPVDGTDFRLPVELSGLPVFDRDRNFRGYRGFGICRAITRIAEISQAGAKPLAGRSSAAVQKAEAPPPPASTEPPVFRDEPKVLKPIQVPVNVLPFRSPNPPADVPPPVEGTPTLTPVERHAFSELASRLSARLRSTKDQPGATDVGAAGVTGALGELPSAHDVAARGAASPSSDQRAILDRLPVGVLVYRFDQMIYANRAFLDWTGYVDLPALQDAGGLDALFVEPGSDDDGDSGTQTFTIATNRGDRVPVQARLFTSPWEGESALVLMLSGPAVGSAAVPGGEAHPADPAKAAEREQTLEGAVREARAEARDTRAILDIAADGVVLLDADANVIWINRGTETLFGYGKQDLIGLPFTRFFAEESQAAAAELLKSAAARKPQGRDVIGRRRDGNFVPLFMTAAPIKEGDKRVCVIFRDMTPWKKSEGELINAKRQAERASLAKSDFLAKISHEIRTPLNAIIGFTEVMMQERFGPIGNDRYQQYLKDIHASGDHVLSLLNDLLDLSKIEAGKLDLNFTSVDLNDVIQQSVALLQPQANRERIIIRTALGSGVPAVTADARSVRQILLNLLSNSIKFTGAGGQVIVSTAIADDRSVVLRVRDTGTGMSEQDIAVALEPFRQIATAPRIGTGGTGLGLPLTKALAEANRASFRIRSAVNAGTLVEVTFPGHRMAAE